MGIPVDVSRFLGSDISQFYERLADVDYDLRRHCTCGHLLGQPGQVRSNAFHSGPSAFAHSIRQMLSATTSQYNWAIRFCNNVVNTGKQGSDRIPEHEMIEFVRTHNIKSLAEFKAEQLKLIEVKARAI